MNQSSEIGLNLSGFLANSVFKFLGSSATLGSMVYYWLGEFAEYLANFSFHHQAIGNGLGAALLRFRFVATELPLIFTEIGAAGFLKFYRRLSFWIFGRLPSCL